MITPRHPQPVAYCWLEGREMSKRMIKHKGCDDPDKQADGRCKWLQWYGERVKATAREGGCDQDVSVREMWDKPGHDNR